MKVAAAKKYKESLYTALSRDLSEFEKNFLLIAAGVLTFSITFIKDIVNIDKATLLFFLFAAWLAFALAVGLIIMTFLHSAYTSDEISLIIESYLQDCGKLEEEDVLEPEQTTELRQRTRTLLLECKNRLKNMRVAAIFAFLVGFTSFGFFVGYNLTQEQQRKKEEEAKTIRIGKGVHSAKVGDWTLTLQDSAVEINKGTQK
jgi:hypothetical protein